MSDKWVVDADYPDGHLVPLTPEEEAQLDADQAAGVLQAKADSIQYANAAAVRDLLAARMTKLRQARTALGNGNIFAALGVNEKAVIDGLLEDNLYLARLTLNLYDGTS